MAIQMRDSGALSEEEFDSLTSRILAGLSVPEVEARASETRR
jgi:methionine aminopeptidase